MDGTLVSTATDLMPYIEAAGGGAAVYLAGQSGEAVAEKARGLLDRIRRRLPAEPQINDVTSALDAALQAGEITQEMVREFAEANDSYKSQTAIHGGQQAGRSIFNGTVHVGGDFTA